MSFVSYVYRIVEIFGYARKCKQSRYVFDDMDYLREIARRTP